MEKAGEDKGDPRRDNILVDGNGKQAIGVFHGSRCSHIDLDSVHYLQS